MKDLWQAPHFYPGYTSTCLMHEFASKDEPQGHDLHVQFDTSLDEFLFELTDSTRIDLRPIGFIHFKRVPHKSFSNIFQAVGLHPAQSESPLPRVPVLLISELRISGV